MKWKKPEQRAPHPHCDERILHSPGYCIYCDHYPHRQVNRMNDKILFTGEAPRPGWEPCPADEARPAGSPSDHQYWPGNVATPRVEMPTVYNGLVDVLNTLQEPK